MCVCGARTHTHTLTSDAYRRAFGLVTCVKAGSCQVTSEVELSEELSRDKQRIKLTEVLSRVKRLAPVK